MSGSVWTEGDDPHYMRVNGLAVVIPRGYELRFHRDLNAYRDVYLLYSYRSEIARCAISDDEIATRSPSEIVASLEQWIVRVTGEPGTQKAPIQVSPVAPPQRVADLTTRHIEIEE